MTILPSEPAPTLEAAANRGDVARAVQQVRLAFERGEHDRGCALAHAAIDAGMRHPLLYYLRALGKGHREEFEEALADFESARALAPDDPGILEATGHCLTMLGRFPEAIGLFDAAVKIRPDFARAHFRRGVALGMLNEIDEMRAAHRRVVELEPRNADALASLAFIAARKSEANEARVLAERAVALAPRHGIARIALAMADIAEGRYLFAEQQLAAVLEGSPAIADGRLNLALGFAADALDYHGRYPAAFHIHATVNARRRQIHERRFGDGRAIDEVTKLIAAASSLEIVAPATRPQQRPAEAIQHVFLLGFVRSGTTLLETILAGHPAVSASDEHDFLASAANALVHGTDLRQLAALDEDALARWRNDYWESVHAAGFSVANKVFVDKVPLNSIRLPLIARLFPHAKIILAIRDPRDVVLSSFRHRFNMYPASFEFLRLDDCARFYAAVMQLVKTVQEKAAFLRLCETRYEDLIVNFDCTVRAICDFLDLEWSASMRDFQSTSQVIDRRSQSAAQVRRGLYQGAAGQWRNYAEQLEPALPILAPWVSRFGYLPDQC